MQAARTKKGGLAVPSPRASRADDGVSVWRGLRTASKRIGVLSQKTARLGLPSGRRVRGSVPDGLGAGSGFLGVGSQ